jgi:hypothetical protein
VLDDVLETEPLRPGVEIGLAVVTAVVVVVVVVVDFPEGVFANIGLRGLRGLKGILVGVTAIASFEIVEEAVVVFASS